MSIRHTRFTRKKYHRGWLYLAVFDGKLSTIAVLVLFGSFLIQPVHEAFAAEPTEEVEVGEEVIADPVKEQISTTVDTETSSESTETLADEQASDEPTVVEGKVGEEMETSDVVVPTETETENENASTLADVVVTESDTAEEAESTTDEMEGSTGTTTTTMENDSSADEFESDVTTQTSTATSTSTIDVISTSTDAVVSSSTTDTVSDEDTDTTSNSTSNTADETEVNVASGAAGGSSTDANQTASSEENESSQTPSNSAETDSPTTNEVESEAVESEDVADATDETGNTNVTGDEPEPIELNYSVTEQNFYQFSKQSCVAVGDGTFHCSEGGADKEIDISSAVYSDVGESGNLEIFMRTSRGKVEQLTDNNRDDSAPHLDAESMRVVWQRMVDSRYQIIVYDIASREETQLTFSRNNNMEPKVSVDGIVWQAWDGNDWEIMYFDGVYTDQITDNEAQDVTPAIQEEYIVWSVLGQEEQLARVYSLESEETMSIQGHEGGTVANPRFVLVYDTQFDNGDVITQGFDPETGIAQPISAQPGQAPIDLPDTDTTGEKLALIQNKGSSKDEKDGIEIKTASSSNAVASSTVLNLQGTVTGELDIATSSEQAEEKVASDETVATSATSTDTDFALSEFDLVILEEDGEVVASSSQRETVFIDRAVIEANRATSTQ